MNTKRKKKAVRPKFSDVETQENIHSYRCKSCWQSVSQPVIKEIFYHNDSYMTRAYDCKNLVPVKWNSIDSEKEYQCFHKFRMTPDLGRALKCILCGYPERFDIMDQKSFRSNYFCITCKKPFKLLSKHGEIHQFRNFEYNMVEHKI